LKFFSFLLTEIFFSFFQAPIYGYTAYGASKWALRGLAEALQMEVKPYNIQVSLAYPPDTDTPGYQEEMLTKPVITKQISESGSVFSAKDVAKNIVEDSEEGYFHISTGMDGWFLKQLHGGMSPMNNPLEVAQQIVLSPLLRLVGVFLTTYWDYVVFSNYKQPSSSSSSSSSSTTTTTAKETKKKE
jgi:3-dehydrosphinganine reductase